VVPTYFPTPCWQLPHAKIARWCAARDVLRRVLLAVVSGLAFLAAVLCEWVVGCWQMTPSELAETVVPLMRAQLMDQVPCGGPSWLGRCRSVHRKAEQWVVVLLSVVPPCCGASFSWAPSEVRAAHALRPPAAPAELGVRERRAAVVDWLAPVARAVVVVPAAADVLVAAPPAGPDLAAGVRPLRAAVVPDPAAALAVAVAVAAAVAEAEAVAVAEDAVASLR
jgi:hypothetical protein